MEANFTVKEAIIESIKLGLKNFLSLIGAVILWGLTIWIPYLNVGTTIGMITLPAKMSRGAIISPTEIFASKYRKYMGEFFLVTGLKSIIMFTAFLFMYFPGLVLQYAFSFATLFVVDKGINPSEAISLSNKCTYGYKWKMFFTHLVLFVVIWIVFLILGFITPILGVIAFVLFMPILLGATAFFYGKLTAHVPSADNPEIVEN
jgi:uncharacterized membrane protein